MSLSTHNEELLRLYCSLPHTPERPRPYDRKLARHWLDNGIPPDQIRAALLLGVSRRLRTPSGPLPLPPIRSIAYFRPILDEVIAAPLDPAYLLYLQELCRREATR